MSPSASNLLTALGPSYANYGAMQPKPFLGRMSTHHSNGTKKACLRLENVRIVDIPKNDYNGHSLTQIKSINSIQAGKHFEETRMSIVTEPTSPFLMPDMTITTSPVSCISNFLQCRSKLVVPFRATMMGMVADARSLEMSNAGMSKLSFSLVDDMGSWIKCCVIGQYATSTALVDGARVILYFAHGRPSNGSADAIVLLLKDSAIVALGKIIPRSTHHSGSTSGRHSNEGLTIQSSSLQYCNRNARGF